MTDIRAREIAAEFVRFLETGVAPPSLLADDVFCDFTSPLWRMQAQGRDAVVALRKQGHPGPGRVPRWRCDATATGFVIEFEESWEHGGKEWSSREMARITVTDEKIAEMSVYCTGDWDDARRARHAEAVRLIRP